MLSNESPRSNLPADPKSRNFGRRGSEVSDLSDESENKYYFISLSEGVLRTSGGEPARPAGGFNPRPPPAD